jgi:hypothetical protein
MNDNIRSAA